MKMGVLNKMKLFLEKQAEEKMISVYWFVIVVLIAGAVVAMVSTFYGDPYDVRDVEANLMINKFSECVSDSGKLNEDFLNQSHLKDNVSLKSVCGFVFEKSSGQAGNQRSEYYLESQFYEVESEKSLANYSAGSRAFKAQCRTQNETQNHEGFAKCVNRTVYVANDTESAYEVNVLAAVSKSDKNVK